LATAEQEVAAVVVAAAVAAGMGFCFDTIGCNPSCLAFCCSHNSYSQQIARMCVAEVAADSMAHWEGWDIHHNSAGCVVARECTAAEVAAVAVVAVVVVVVVGIHQGIHDSGVALRQYFDGQEASE
jgi:hypothetical protein